VGTVSTSRLLLCTHITCMYTSLRTLIGAHRQISFVSTLGWLYGSMFKNVFTFSFLSCVFTAHSPLKKGKKAHSWGRVVFSKNPLPPLGGRPAIFISHWPISAAMSGLACGLYGYFSTTSPGRTGGTSWPCR
jgi:hypothetical protein